MRKNLQLSFATYEAALRIPGSDPIKIAFENINWNFIYEALKTKYSTLGREGYDPVSLFKALLLLHLGEACSQRELARKLSFDARLCFLCGFYDFKRIPSHPTFTMFRKRLGEKLFKEIYHRLLEIAKSRRLIKTADFGLDATHIQASSNTKQPSDPDARWGHKSETKKFFGYKVHLLVEKSSQLPTACKVSAGNAHDANYAIPLLNQSLQEHPQVMIENLSADAIYDAHKVYQGVSELHINPFIPLKRYKNPCLSGELELSEDGWRCLAGHRLVNWGYCKKRRRHKLRCPHVLGKANCLLKEACSSAPYGRVFYLHPTDDLRLIGPVVRGSYLWNRNYKTRTCTERLFAELKARHRLDDLLVRGLAQVKIHVFLALTALLLKRLAERGRRAPPDI